VRFAGGSIEASRLTFPEGEILFSLMQGSRNRFARRAVPQSRGIGGSLARGWIGLPCAVAPPINFEPLRHGSPQPVLAQRLPRLPVPGDLFRRSRVFALEAGVVRLFPAGLSAATPAGERPGA